VIAATAAGVDRSGRPKLRHHPYRQRPQAPIVGSAALLVMAVGAPSWRITWRSEGPRFAPQAAGDPSGPSRTAGAECAGVRDSVAVPSAADARTSRASQRQDRPLFTVRPKGQGLRGLCVVWVKWHRPQFFHSPGLLVGGVCIPLSRQSELKSFLLSTCSTSERQLFIGHQAGA